MWNSLTVLVASSWKRCANEYFLTVVIFRLCPLRTPEPIQVPGRMVVVLGHRRIATCLEHAKCSKDQGFQATTPPSGVRRWGSNPLAGEEARRRKRQGTHPPPRLHGFGRSHPNPMLITACLLHNAVRAGLIFAGISTLVIFAGITAKVRARSAHVRVPGECACLLPCIPSSGGELAQQEAAMASRCSSSTTRLLTDPCSLACLLARLLCAQ